MSKDCEFTENSSLDSSPSNRFQIKTLFMIPEDKKGRGEEQEEASDEPK